jgi:hypothetical protein
MRPFFKASVFRPVLGCLFEGFDSLSTAHAIISVFVKSNSSTTQIFDQRRECDKADVTGVDCHIGGFPRWNRSMRYRRHDGMNINFTCFLIRQIRLQYLLNIEAQSSGIQFACIRLSMTLSSSRYRRDHGNPYCLYTGYAGTPTNIYNKIRSQSEGLTTPLVEIYSTDLVAGRSCKCSAWCLEV